VSRARAGKPAKPRAPRRPPLRVLDLGCHDGYVTGWVRKQMRGRLVVDGLELHPGAAAKARQRLNGTVLVGRAEDAPTLFEPHTHDAVVAFELIEHVPDMDVFLDACETMLKPGGRVYISTPDGCFGEGNNPHHLRALRAVDLAELLRRRGHLVDFGVGEDGITVGCYTPAPRLGEVAIYTGPGWEQWHPMDAVTKGLGGSETAAYNLASQLAGLGYIVTLYGYCQEGAVRDVMVRDWRTFDPSVHRQAVISSRLPEVFDRLVNADTKLLWLHDTDCGDRLTPAHAAQLDGVIALSQWHLTHVRERYPFLEPPQLYVSRNGITHDYFVGENLERERRVLYTSSPDRGLDVLLELWPQIVERVPDAELLHCYADVYDRVADQNPTIAEHRDRIRQLGQQEGVRAIGSLAQPRVAELMRTALVWAHPSYCTPAGEKFYETSCIGAMEAQAAGCRVVAGGWGALRETVQTGALVDGDPTSAEWRSQFVEEIVAGLTDEQLQARAQSTGPAAVADLDWAGVAEQFAALISPG
jgi:glycosyltransferase involved in cell wall biosynthesis